MNKTEDILNLLKNEYECNRVHTSGHKIRNGEKYVELRNALFRVNNDYIIDAPEYEDLLDGQWYVKNYEFRMNWQLPIIVDKLIKDSDSRQTVVGMYNANDELENNDDMICTMYVSLRLDEYPEMYTLSYTVHMRSSDAREFRSDLKFHKSMMLRIMHMLSSKLNKPVYGNAITWYADSLQCWDKDFSYLV